MIIKSLYESLLNCINEARVSRTIDKKLWLSIASTCSRNKVTEAENVKPRASQSKEELLPRYVAALLIMKKQCPESEQDIDDIKTFKLVGKRLLQLGCTIDEIKQEYINNGGKLVTNTINVQPKQVEQKLNTEVKQDTQVKVDNTEQKKVIKQPTIVQKKLPDGIKSYEDTLKFVKRGYDSLSEVCECIYNILDKTYYTIQKSFYKIEEPTYKLYFRTVTTDEDQKVYFNDKHCIYISWVKTSKKRVYEGTFCILENNMTINDEPISDKIELDDNTFITYEQLYELCQIALAKLSYSSQRQYNNPFLPKNKVINNTLGKFGNKKRDFNEEIDSHEIEKIMPKVIRKYSTIKKCLICLEILLYKNKLGNTNNGMSFELNEPIYEGKFFNSNKKFYITGYDYDPSPKIHVEYINSESKTADGYISSYSCGQHQSPASFIGSYNMLDDGDLRIDMKEIQNILWCLISAILYYNNNYDNFIQ